MERKRAALAAVLRLASAFGARHKYTELAKLRELVQSALHVDENVLRVLVVSECDARRIRLLQGLLGYEKSDGAHDRPTSGPSIFQEHPSPSHKLEADVGDVISWTDLGAEFGDPLVRRIRYGSRIMVTPDDDGVCIQWPSTWLTSGGGIEVIDLARM